MDFCCSNCFNDVFLERRIKELSGNTGKCNYCEKQNTEIIEVNKLQDLFEEIFDLYEENQEGLLLSELLYIDWKMFEINKHIANRLLSDILNISEILTVKYINKIEKTSEVVWDNFKEELKHKNRYFPNDKEFNKEDLKDIFQYFETIDYPKEIFRARISKDRKIILNERMGKPPSGQLTQGRANPVGISYLYVASNIQTAISEIRPDKGDIVTVSKINLPDNLRFLDIRSPKNTISPFHFSDNILEAVYKDLDLLEKFGEELSKPILPREAGIEYLASQYLSELIKHSGFDGMLYTSSIGDGFNIVIFNNVELNFIESNLYSINNIAIEFSEING